MGVARCHEHGAAMVPSGQAAASPRSSCPGLWLVQRGLGYAGHQGGKDLARRARVVTLANIFLTPRAHLESKARPRGVAAHKQPPCNQSGKRNSTTARFIASA